MNGARSPILAACDRMNVMKRFVIVFISTAATAIAGEGLELEIRKVRQHSFLADHGRVLVLKSDNKVIAERRIYGDPGRGSPLHFVRGTNAITAIDADGTWYSISSKGINKLGWHWMKALPKGRVRRLSRDERNHYVTVEVKAVELTDVYIYKDPGDH